jgi:hypothetical protein
MQLETSASEAVNGIDYSKAKKLTLLRGVK